MIVRLCRLGSARADKGQNGMSKSGGWALLVARLRDPETLHRKFNFVSALCFTSTTISETTQTGVIACGSMEICFQAHDKCA